ncbi:class I SAM-dependent methyltransferase [Candidatus Zixiibacteriota bacterium]
MRDDSRRYAQLGWTYEKFNPLQKEAMAWHRQMARTYGGPILELACGSGRLCTGLAMAGFMVDAIDQSSAMLARAQMRIGAHTDDTRNRIKIFRADICSFALNSTYKLIILADNSLAELPESDRGRCLQCARVHLNPAGRLLLTARVYEADDLADGQLITPWSEPVTHPITGVTVRRKTELHLSDDGTRLEGEMTYEITKPDETVEFETVPVKLARYTRKDYESLFAANGWHVDSGDSPVTRDGVNDSSVVRFVCGGE